MQKRFFSLLAVSFLFAQLSFSQSDKSGSSGFGGLSSGIPVYIDQVGLQIVNQQLMNPSNTNQGIVNPDTYTLSPFDVVSFQFEGNFSLMVKSAVINAQGDVAIPQVGLISLGNKTISEADQALKQFAKDRFIKTTVSYLTLDYARTITIQVVGNLKKSTDYTLPGLTRLSSVLNLAIAKFEVDKTKDVVNKTNDASDFSLFSDKSQLFESTLRTPKLITEEFNINSVVDGSISLRDIKIKHPNGAISSIDFVRYLKIGDSNQNPVLQNGDVIELSAQSAYANRVSVSGSVNSEGEFSFKSGERLSSLVQLGSGFTAIADTSYALVLNPDGNAQKIAYGNWDSFEIKPNMRVVIPQKRDAIPASVQISGQVVTPGMFPIKDGKTTLDEALSYTGGFIDNALLKGVYILRENAVPININETNELDVLLKRTSDQYAQGLKYLDIELGIGQNRVYVDASKSETLKEITLQDGDKIFVPRDNNSIIVFGQVNKPGVYRFEKGKLTDSYIEQAGGIAIAGVKNRIFVIKAGSKNWEKPENTSVESGDMIFIDRKPYEDFVTSQQLEMSKTQLKLSTWSLIISAISTTALIISVVAR